MVEEAFVIEFDITHAMESLPKEDFLEWYHKERDFGKNLKGKPITHFEVGKSYIFHIENCSPSEYKQLNADYYRTPEYMIPFDGKPHLCVEAVSSISLRFGAIFEEQTTNKVYRYVRSLYLWEEIQ